jgi:hypothetical protein
LRNTNIKEKTEAERKKRIKKEEIERIKVVDM